MAMIRRAAQLSPRHPALIQMRVVHRPKAFERHQPN
jgi:hypothetical protein